MNALQNIYNIFSLAKVSEGPNLPSEPLTGNTTPGTVSPEALGSTPTSNECAHVHFTVQLHNYIGCGVCSDCGRTVNLAILFNGLAQRMIRLESEFGKRISEFGKKEN